MKTFDPPLDKDFWEPLETMLRSYLSKEDAYYDALKQDDIITFEMLRRVKRLIASKVDGPDFAFVKSEVERKVRCATEELLEMRPDLTKEQASVVLSMVGIERTGENIEDYEARLNDAAQDLYPNDDYPIEYEDNEEDL